MRDWNVLAKAPSQARARSRSPIMEEAPRISFPLPLPPSLTITTRHKEASPGREKEADTTSPTTDKQVGDLNRECPQEPYYTTFCDIMTVVISAFHNHMGHCIVNGFPMTFPG